MKTKQFIWDCTLDERTKESRTLNFSSGDNFDKNFVKMIDTVNSPDRLTDSSIKKENQANIYKHFF